jgi:hypothetical protein
MKPETVERWKRFHASNGETASRIRELILPACEVMHGKEPHEQVRLLQTHHDCTELYGLLRENRELLGIHDDPYAYAAFTLKLCYCTLMRAEQKRTA